MSAYPATRRRRGLGGLIAEVDDFMGWLLYGHETWLVALLKGVPLFLYVYFLLTYIPNYVFYLVTQVIPFLRLSDDFGFLIANVIGGGNFTVLIGLALWTQAARGRRGFGWSLIRLLDFLQLVGILLVLIPLMAFNLAGGTFFPNQGQNPFPLQALGFGAVVAGMGAMTLGYLFFEYRRVMRREAQRAAERSAAYSAT